MVQIVKNDLQTGVKHYVADTVEDMKKISLRAFTINMGTTCFVIEKDATYILDGSGRWVAVSNYGSGGGGSSSGSGDGSGDSEPSDTLPPDTPIDEENDYIWDSGEVKE